MINIFHDNVLVFECEYFEILISLPDCMSILLFFCKLTSFNWWHRQFSEQKNLSSLNRSQTHDFWLKDLDALPISLFNRA